MVQWRTCSTVTVFTTQARQRTARLAEHHRESRSKLQKTLKMFYTVRAAFVVSTSDCKSAASVASRQNRSGVANQIEKLNHYQARTTCAACA